MDYVVAQVNIGRLVAPLDSPRLADFVAGLDPVNGGRGRRRPGSCGGCRPRTGTRPRCACSSMTPKGSDGGILINMSVWETVEDLAALVYGEGAPRGAAAAPRGVRAAEGRLRRAVVDPRGHIPTSARPRTG